LEGGAYGLVWWQGEDLICAQNYLFNKICFNLFISDIEHTNQFGIQVLYVCLKMLEFIDDSDEFEGNQQGIERDYMSN